MNPSKIDTIEKEILPLYETPFVYKQIEEKIVNKLNENKENKLNKNKEKVTAYLQKKKEKCNNTEIQGFLDVKCLDEKYIFNNTTRLKNALHLKDLADKSSMEVKPILYYYSAEQFMNFFIYSLVKVPSPKTNHGISVKVDEKIECTKITIKSKGFFARLVDVYSILGYESIFSPVIVRYAFGQSEPTYNFNNTNFSLIKDRECTLKCLIDDIPNGNQISLDLRNLILLYVASHFARYSPYLWKQIVDGVKSPYIINFKKTFSEYRLVIVKHIDFLDSWKNGMFSRLDKPNDFIDHDVSTHLGLV